MKKGLYIACILFTLQTFSQQIIKGKVSSKTNTPLEGASVFFNNTTIGALTNDKGEFELPVRNNNTYTLVVSYLGYKTYQKQINTLNTEYLTIQLDEDNELLDEVEIPKTKYDDEWKYNLARFKKVFLGRTKLAEECIIQNEKDLHFDYDAKTNTLTAIARKPLQIKHKGLGYLITYDLVDFSLDHQKVFFSGFAQYKKLRKSIRKKWKENRLKAYNGSQMHYLRSLMDKKLEEDGFVVNQFRRVKNEARPTEKEIQFAREYIKLQGGVVRFSNRNAIPKTKLDSAYITLRKARELPKFRDYLYKSNIPYEEMISYEKDIPYLDFKDYLMVVYTKEPEEENFVKGMFGKNKRKAQNVQTSNLVLLKGKAQIDPSGILLDPNAAFQEEYWGFEAFANMLPLDYQPIKE